MMKRLLFLYILIASYVSNYAQQSYYNDIDFTKTGIALKEALALKIINTHTNYLSYSPDVWEASRKTDVNPNNSNEVMLIYGYTSSGTTSRTRDIDKNGGNVGDWNREHSYPKSLGNPDLGTSGPGADAHHLRPSDVQYNGQRGNKKFVDGSGNSGEINGNWFPGDEWKGDIARMMMYMYLRYDSQCLPSAVGIGNKSNTPDDMIDLFLKWNAEDPVSDIEDNRNGYHENTQNAYAQGNRNPFIDNPYLATKIWGSPPSGTNQPEDRWGTLSTTLYGLDNISVYPNPTSINRITITIPNQLNINSIILYSVIGSKIYDVKNPVLKNDKIRIDNLKSGVYLLRISSDEGSLTKKVVVQ